LTSVAETSLDSFNCRRTLKVGKRSYDYFDLKEAEANGLTGVGRLPFSLKVLLENLLRYEDGKPAPVPSSVEEAAIGIAAKLDMSRPQIRRDLLLEKTIAFGRSPLFNRVFELADKQGKPMPRQAMPQIDLKSPKITRKLTTEWFARRVDGRYRSCLGRIEASL